MALGSTQPLMEMSTWWYMAASRRVSLINSSSHLMQLYRQCRSLDVSQPYDPSRPIKGKAFI
jgi:hypothetical protein